MAAVWRVNDATSVERRSGWRSRESREKNIVPSMNELMAMRDLAHLYDGVTGWPDTPRARKTTFPFEIKKKNRIRLRQCLLVFGSWKHTGLHACKTSPGVERCTV